MLINLEVSFNVYGKVRAGVAPNLLKHVIEKSKSGCDVAYSVSIKIDAHVDIGFLSRSTYFPDTFSSKEKFCNFVP